MYLITQSLLSSWEYLFSCYEDKCDEAYESFVKTLKREPTEQTDAQRKGTEFETEVYKVVRGEDRQPHPEWENGIKAVAEHLKGCQVQVKEKAVLEVGENKFLLYGVLDALGAGVIKDVKFSTRSFGSTDLAGKYLESPQHPAYFRLVPEAYRFDYIVSDGEDVYVESYFRKNTPPIDGLINQFVVSIKDMGLWELYQKHWVARE
jgi:hypothetical protein